MVSIAAAIVDGMFVVVAIITGIGFFVDQKIFFLNDIKKAKHGNKNS